MAPRGGKGSAPAGRAGRGHQQSALSSTTRAGGIQKRRSDRARVDRDGDLVMDANSADGPNKRRGGGPAVPKIVSRARQQVILNGLGKSSTLNARITHAPARITRTTNPENSAVLKVTGLKESKAASNPGGGLADIVGFLERKTPKAANSNRQVKIKKSRLDGPFVYILVPKDDAEDIQKISGFQFAGATLKIEPGPTDYFNKTLSDASERVKSQLKEVLQRRYNPESKFLDLSDLANDAQLAQIGAFESKGLSEKLFRTLMHICDTTFATPEAKIEAVFVVSLARNGLTDVKMVMALADTFPGLKQLDLSGNNIAEIRGLTRWKYKLQSLEGLLLNDNPIVGNVSDLKTQLMLWYPRLMIYNHETVRTPEQAEADAELYKQKRQPAPIAHKEPVYEDSSGLGEPFIRDFFPSYDTNRAELAAKYYDSDSIFTLSVDTHAPRSMSVTAAAPWGSYIKLSRNLKKITTTNGRHQRTYKGLGNIAEVWKQLPETRHPDLSTELSKYIIECRPRAGLPDPVGQSLTVDGLQITINGEFLENDPAGPYQRSFTRSIILGPARPGAANVFRIVSDMLALRAWKPVPPIMSLGQRTDMIMALSHATNMTLGYSEMCLSDVGFNPDLALKHFEEHKATLPPEAFLG